MPTCTLNNYFKRYANPKPIIKTNPSKQLGLVITIPCYNEPNLIGALESLIHCYPTKVDVEVIVVINHCQSSDDAIKTHNLETYKIAKQFANKHNRENFQIHIIYKEFHQKQAGVGMARKIGMDEAARRLEQGVSKGVIAGFDADCTCTKNYLVELEKLFYDNPKINGCSIHFEHPIEGSYDRKIYNAIIDYELHLRYYKNALKYAGARFYYYTVGSSMAVRNTIYQNQGGMNKRKAGEDFYFLQKIIALGNFAELKTATVFPSPRVSNRVPFGTGKAVNNWLTEKKLETFHPFSFDHLKNHYTTMDQITTVNEELVDSLLNDDGMVRLYLKTIGYQNELKRIMNHSKNIDTFFNHYHKWFDALKVLKFLNWSRDHHYSNIDILEASNGLLSRLGIPNRTNSLETLLIFRTLDKS